MGYIKIPYYVVLKGRGYWRPTPRMKQLGFSDVRCGPDGPAARMLAETWNARWQAARKGQREITALPSPHGLREKSEVRRVYPPGSVGAAFKAYLQTEEWRKKAPGTRDKVWWPAWFRIREIWGDCDPNTITFEQMSIWRTDLERAHGIGVAHKTLKIWRALWVVMRAMRIAHGDDPSKGVRNAAPKPRHQTWEEREAILLVKTAWRHGYKGLACIIAVTWDTLFQPVDVRTLKAKHRKARVVQVERDGKLISFKQRYFDRSDECRAKTGRPAIGTVSNRTAKVVDTYLESRDVPLTPEFVLFRTRSGKEYTDEDLSHDFAAVRSLTFGTFEKRQLRDMRRAGTIEAVAGGAKDGDLASKLANSIDRSNILRKTYAPVDIAAVLHADEARRKGRKRRSSSESW